MLLKARYSTQEHSYDLAAEDGWDGAVPASRCTCCFDVSYCVMVDEIA